MLGFRLRPCFVSWPLVGRAAARLRQAAGIYRRLGSVGAIAQAEILELAASLGAGVVLQDRRWQIDPTIEVAGNA